jgi:PQQ-dependent dehydrogenase (methanol/ethanol family)
MIGPRTLALALALAALASCLAGTARADGTGWFTADQVSTGRTEYGQKCAVCHGSQLQGTGAPALRGRSFGLQWNHKSLGDFYSYVHKQMPLGYPDTLKAQEYADIVAFILAQNGLPGGQEKFTPQTPMNRVLRLGPAARATLPAVPPVQARLFELTDPVKQPSSSGPSQAELDGADADTTNWLMYNKGYRAGRYSTLAKINAGNARNLRPVCMFQLGELGTFHTGPVVYDGILYATTHLGTYAIDAYTCKRLWRHEHLPTAAEMNATNRGVAIGGGRVVRGTQDGYLFALDAKTGALLWQRQIADPAIGAGVGAAPLIWNDMVFMGNAGGDWGIKGAVMAFRLSDGERIWHFNTIPTGKDAGAETWEKPGSAIRGGGAAWTAYALDRATETLFVPIGNAGPDFYRAARPGANLFTSSVVALDARTGKLKWWHQLRPNDDHDYDTTVVSLFDADGKAMVATAGKDGVLHVLDRVDGKLRFKLPVTTTLNQDVPLTASGIRVCPVAGVQWNGAAYSPQTKLLYVNAIDWCTTFRLGPEPQWVATIPYTGLVNGFGTNDPTDRWNGWINAVDPATGKMRWRFKSPTPMYAAVTPTAGGVLFTGDLNGDFMVVDARSGKVVYRFDTGGPIAGGVVTYEKNGKQYVAVAAGNSGGSIPLQGASTIVIFGL